MPSYPMQTDGGALTQKTLNSLISMVNAVFGTPGQVWWVNPKTGNDQNDGQTPQTAFATLAKAHASAADGNNDVVYLVAASQSASLTTAYQGSALTWSKNLLHLVGVNAGSFISQRSRVATLASAAAFANLFVVSGSGCLFWNLEFYQGAGSTTLSAAQTCVTVTGVRNRFLNCTISGIGDSTLDYAGSNSLTISSADENIFQHCYIGLDTVIRASATNEVIITGTTARSVFEDCTFASYTSGSTFKAVAIGTAVDRFVQFKNCTFYTAENITSAVAPTGAIGITTMNGQVQVINPAVFGYSLLSTSGNTYVKVLAFQNATSVQGIGASAASS